VKNLSNSPILEIQESLKLFDKFKRSPRQINSRYETDAEIIKLNSEQYLAATVDSICEEFKFGLVKNPKSMGWLMVTASVSDLAAVGARPLGLINSITSPEKVDRKILDLVLEGIQEACEHYETFVFGGDMGSGSEWNLACTAFGLLDSKPITRILNQEENLGSKIKLYLTAPIGWGNAVALANTANLPGAENFDKSYRPKAKIKAGQIIREQAEFCMDTSDGLMTTLDFLCDLNNFEVSLDYKKDLFHPSVSDIVGMSKLPHFVFAAGQNGEFELVFGVRDSQEQKLVSDLEQINLKPICIGEINYKTICHSVLDTESRARGAGIGLKSMREKETGSQTSNSKITINNRPTDLSAIRNLLYKEIKPHYYIEQLVEFSKRNELF